MTMYKDFVTTKAKNAEAIKKLQVLEEQSRTLNDGLRKALETKTKLEAKEFDQRKNIDRATSHLKVKYRRLEDVKNHLQQCDLIILIAL